MKYTAKGFLVTCAPFKIKDKIYHGVDTQAWPIGFCFANDLVENLYEESFADLSFPFLVDYDSALAYAEKCRANGIMTRLLYCEVLSQCGSKKQPNWGNSAAASFLGYDYAYPSGDYFSVILNELLYPETNYAFHWKAQLNQYGLVPSLEVMHSLVKERTSLMNQSDGSLLHEKGNFVLYRIFALGQWTEMGPELAQETDRP